MGSQLGFSTSMCFMDVQRWRLDQTWCRNKKRASDCLVTKTLAQQWLVLGIWTYSKPKKQIGFSSYLTIEILHFFAFSKDYSWNILKHLETSWNPSWPETVWVRKRAALLRLSLAVALAADAASLQALRWIRPLRWCEKLEDVSFPGI